MFPSKYTFAFIFAEAVSFHDRAGGIESALWGEAAQVGIHFLGQGNDNVMGDLYPRPRA